MSSACPCAISLAPRLSPRVAGLLLLPELPESDGNAAPGGTRGSPRHSAARTHRANELCRIRNRALALSSPGSNAAPALSYRARIQGAAHAVMNVKTTGQSIKCPALGGIKKSRIKNQESTRRSTHTLLLPRFMFLAPCRAAQMHTSKLPTRPTSRTSNLEPGVLFATYPGTRVCRRFDEIAFRVHSACEGALHVLSSLS